MWSNTVRKKKFILMVNVVLMMLAVGFLAGCISQGKEKVIDDEGSDEHSFIPRYPAGLQWAIISPGTFIMGSSTGSPDEIPPHNVTISRDFQMGIYEVTQSQWAAVMGDNPSYFVGEDNPVECVSWSDCQLYISKLNELDPDHTYRLPTEAEQEYCRRAGNDTRYCFGDDEHELGNHAWYSANSNNQTHQVGQKDPNAFGLYDMHGNVWEWCLDWYGRDYYAHSPSLDPLGPVQGTYHVRRGGGWNSEAEDCRSSFRYGLDPVSGYGSIGLRLVRI